jgi:photosystem II PsbU protein
MKRLLSWLTGALLMASLIAALVLPSSVYADDDLRSKYSGNEIRNVVDDKIAESEGKVDLNNSSVRRFQQFPGMYPTMAGKIVLGGPYNSVEDVLSLDLTDRQQELFAKYRDNFIVTPPSIALNEGDDRINDGQYR